MEVCKQLSWLAECKCCRMCLDVVRVDSSGGERKAAVCYCAYGYMGASLVHAFSQGGLQLYSLASW